METHFSILVQEIPWTEEPRGLQSWGCRIRYDLATEQQQQHYRHPLPRMYQNPRHPKENQVFSINCCLHKKLRHRKALLLVKKCLYQCRELFIIQVSRPQSRDNLASRLSKDSIISLNMLTLLHTGPLVLNCTINQMRKENQDIFRYSRPQEKLRPISSSSGEY